jgi:hypothetical protein
MDKLINKSIDCCEGVEGVEVDMAQHRVWKASWTRRGSVIAFTVKHRRRNNPQVIGEIRAEKTHITHMNIME